MTRNHKTLDMLICTAMEMMESCHEPNQHVVGSALQLNTGEIVTGVEMRSAGEHLECAEAVALKSAVSQYKRPEIKAIVSMCHRASGTIDIVSPCGMCRDMIRRYSPNAWIILPSSTAPYTVSRLCFMA